MIDDLAVYYLFENLATNGSERNWSVVRWFWLVLFLNIGQANAFSNHLILVSGQEMLERSDIVVLLLMMTFPSEIAIKTHLVR